MKIGLLRHFKVNRRAPKHCNSEEYDRSISEYDRADIIIQNVAVSPADYPVCYASSMKRAVETAREVYDNEIIFTDELVEIPLRSIFKTTFKLPFKLWNVINRLGWAFNSKKVPEPKHRSRERAVRFLEKILESNDGNQNILIVSHGLFMVNLQIELSRLGFKGDGFFRAEHGRLYEFHRPG